MQISFGEAVGAVLSTVAVAVIAYAVVGQQNAIALGALITIVAAANGFFLRAKVQSPTPTDPNVSPTPQRPVVVERPPTVLVDGHELPFQKPPPAPLP